MGVFTWHWGGIPWTPLNSHDSVDGSEIPRPTTWDVRKPGVNRRSSTTNLNWWVCRISEPSTVLHVSGKKYNIFFMLWGLCLEMDQGFGDTLKIPHWLKTTPCCKGKKNPILLKNSGIPWIHPGRLTAGSPKNHLNLKSGKSSEPNLHF